MKINFELDGRVGKATRLHARQLKNQGVIPERATNLFLLQNDQNTSGADPASYSASTEGSFVWGKVDSALS